MQSETRRVACRLSVTRHATERKCASLTGFYLLLQRVQARGMPAQLLRIQTFSPLVTQGARLLTVVAYRPVLVGRPTGWLTGWLAG